MGGIMKLKRMSKSILTVTATMMILGVTESFAQHHMYTETGEHCEHSMQKASAALSPAGVMGDHVHSRGSWMFSQASEFQSDE